MLFHWTGKWEIKNYHYEFIVTVENGLITDIIKDLNQFIGEPLDNLVQTLIQQSPTTIKNLEIQSW